MNAFKIIDITLIMGERIEVTLQKAQEADLVGIARIALGHYPNNFTNKGKHPLELVIDWIRSKYMAAENFVYTKLLVAKHDGDVVGYTWSETIAAGYGNVDVREWGVKKEYEGRGIGGQLINQTEAIWLKDHTTIFGQLAPLKSMKVYTGGDGVDLCERRSFRIDVTHANHYGPGLNEYVMRKDYYPDGRPTMTRTPEKGIQ